MVEFIQDFLVVLFIVVTFTALIYMPIYYKRLLVSKSRQQDIDALTHTQRVIYYQWFLKYPQARHSALIYIAKHMSFY